MSDLQPHLWDALNLISEHHTRAHICNNLYAKAAKAAALDSELKKMNKKKKKKRKEKVCFLT